MVFQHSFNDILIFCSSSTSAELSSAIVRLYNSRARALCQREVRDFDMLLRASLTCEACLYVYSFCACVGDLQSAYSASQFLVLTLVNSPHVMHRGLLHCCDLDKYSYMIS